jgi:hypothetical protein
MWVPAALRSLVVARARSRCEYCRLHQQDEAFAAFHIEHIIARQHGGTTDDANLALSCHYCNAHKGPNLVSVDPHSEAIAPLFNPRTQAWSEHFITRAGRIEGLTPTGRATARLLAMNDRIRVELRLHASEPAEGSA